MSSAMERFPNVGIRRLSVACVHDFDDGAGFAVLFAVERAHPRALSRRTKSS